MARGACTFRKQDVTRALRATVAAGVNVRRVEIDKAGKIVIVAGKPSPEKGEENQTDMNEWDAVR